MSEGREIDKYKLIEAATNPEGVFEAQVGEKAKFEVLRLAGVFRQAAEVAERFQTAIARKHESLDELKKSYNALNNPAEKIKLQAAIDALESRIYEEEATCGNYADKAEALRAEFDAATEKILGGDKGPEIGQ